jgi:HD-GYP domain-containing protein (c-di-GMP phosphodiesterase class II)
VEAQLAHRPAAAFSDLPPLAPALPGALRQPDERMQGSLRYLQHELTRTHDMLVEGWVRLLHQRDTETAGHTRRVAAATLRLARALGVSRGMISHIRRGALLHDIGKLWVPSHVLNKPGRLTEAEWAIMRQHPVYAYNLLMPVAALRPALDIPYCHHERWDGAGYPGGLSGAAIPLAARIFAVVDVWDALSFDRPYRAAWPAARVREHLREGAGTHFDPTVVEVFLRIA